MLDNFIKNTSNAIFFKFAITANLIITLVIFISYLSNKLNDYQDKIDRIQNVHFQALSSFDDILHNDTSASKLNKDFNALLNFNKMDAYFSALSMQLTTQIKAQHLARDLEISYTQCYLDPELSRHNKNSAINIHQHRIQIKCILNAADLSSALALIDSILPKNTVYYKISIDNLSVITPENIHYFESNAIHRNSVQLSVQAILTTLYL
ncbi:hypothetical protein Sarmat_00551 [Rickettsiales endosymbiont of Paramecium tredecaurelia]|uniref:hypothetical protein n=1 Tax=Candidatus Sarmatiella mevalonica TaxID=2770581 RepID=UPI001923E2A1|nr:hypothetical protein [Candidatus Sarmatiella mevalonica]MBL3284699.1 hypothetical protein [Candidatus Sarmatiella mevalonica]